MSYPLRFQYFGIQATLQEKYLYFKTHKSFLRKNRKRIITKKFIDKMGSLKSIELFKKAKTIFLIDKSEIKNGEILIKQVVFHEFSIIL